MSSPVPTIRLKPRKALPFHCQHPWVFATAIGRIDGSPDTGDEVRLVSESGEFIARGLYNPSSKIRVRLYRWEDLPLDADYWRLLIQRAVGLRKLLFSEGSDAARFCRLVFSEGDGLSGLTVDRYDDFLLTQWTSAALFEQRDLIISLLAEEASPSGIWRRTEKNMGHLEGLEAHDGLVWGSEPPAKIDVVENGVTYNVDVVSGQKTGFYYDQRENRRAVANFTSGANVLDVCSYTGSFGLNALVNGQAASVLAVDSSQSAIDAALEHARVNNVSDRYSVEVGDAFDTLQRLASESRRFEVVVLDPPKLARTRSGLQRALKAYVRWNEMAMQVTAPGGILATCSCSGHVSRDDLEHVLVEAAQRAGRTVQIIEERGQASDHPVSAHCLETSYLKCFICRIL